MSTALVPARLPLSQRIRYAFTGTPEVIIYPEDPTKPDAIVHSRTIEVYRPPTTLSDDGQALQGVTEDLFKHYLIATVEEALGQRVGNAQVTFGQVVGRFAQIGILIDEWAATLNFVIPIGAISMPLKNGLDLYMAGIALKAAQAHRGTQVHTRANQLFDQAKKHFISLRDDDIPHYRNEGEFMLLVTSCHQALSVSPLVPTQGGAQILQRGPNA